MGLDSPAESQDHSEYIMVSCNAFKSLANFLLDTEGNHTQISHSSSSVSRPSNPVEMTIGTEAEICSQVVAKGDDDDGGAAGHEGPSGIEPSPPMT